MVTNTEKQKTYSRFFFVVALIMAVNTCIFINQHCTTLAYIDGILTVVQIGLGTSVRYADYFVGHFVTSGISLMAYTLLQHILLGPQYGFQYLYIGIIPAVFYIFNKKADCVKKSIITTSSLLLVFLVATSITNAIRYPLFKINKVSFYALVVINIITAFLAALYFMILISAQASTEQNFLKDMNSDLELTANKDNLTGLGNRKSMEEHLDKAIARAKGEGQDFTIFMCDLDNFKHVNDTYGHDCGDLVLQNIAKIIKTEIRPDDYVFRYGGEEILILVYAGNYVSKKIAERCRAAIEESEVEYKGNTIKVTITIGGASYYQGATKEILIKRSDNNLYNGKESGKNCVVI